MARTSNFLIMYNVVMLVLGVIMFGIGIYVKQTAIDQGWSAVFSATAVWVAIFAGLFMVIISFLGCYAARKNKKILLCWYLICVAVVLAFEIAAAAVTLQYASTISAMQTEGVPSGSIVDDNQFYVNNALLNLYATCCTGCPSASYDTKKTGETDAIFAQKQVVWGKYSSQGYLTTCDNLDSTAAVCVACVPAGPCQTSTDRNCYYYGYGTEFKFPAGNAKFLPPPRIDFTLCNVLKQTAFNGANLVGPNGASCGGGNAGVFRNNVINYFYPKMYFAGVAFACIATVQSIVIFVGCYIICFVSKRDVTGDADVESSYERDMDRLERRARRR